MLTEREAHQLADATFWLGWLVGIGCGLLAASVLS